MVLASWAALDSVKLCHILLQNADAKCLSLQVSSAAETARRRQLRQCYPASHSDIIDGKALRHQDAAENSNFLERRPKVQIASRLQGCTTEPVPELSKAPTGLLDGYAHRYSLGFWNSGVSSHAAMLHHAQLHMSACCCMASVHAYHMRLHAVVPRSVYTGGHIMFCLAVNDSWCCGTSMMLLRGLPPSPWHCRHSWARHHQIARLQLHWACLQPSHCQNAWLLERYTRCCFSLSDKITFQFSDSAFSNFCVRLPVRLLVLERNQYSSCLLLAHHNLLLHC